MTSNNFIATIVSNTDDYSFDTTTNGVVTVDGMATSGVINSMTDADLFKVSFTAGSTYFFTLAPTSDSLLVPYLELYNPNFEPEPLVYDNESAKVSYTASSNGTYYLGVISYFISDDPTSPVIEGGTGGYTLSATIDATTPIILSKLDDFVLPQYASPSVVGAGEGNDTYLLSNALLPTGTNLTISDPQGSNSIQLADGLAIASSKFNSTTLQLTLNNGSVINVLAADTFTYEAGGNSTAGINQADVGYATFVQSTLGGIMPTGTAIASGGALVVGGGAAMPAMSVQSKADNFVVAQYATPSVLGAGEGNDTYLLSSSLLPAGLNFSISDPQGSNSIQLADGLAIASSLFTSNTLQLTLNNGSVINVLAADTFTYEAGGNSTAGINQTDVSYASFVQNTLGGVLPTGNGVASGGSVVIGGGMPLLADIALVGVQPLLTFDL
jgi:hypothetical protein